jgi:pectinesterase
VFAAAGGDGFMARDLAIYNTAGGPHDEQAVALSVSSNLSVFYRCDLMGFQDTLLAYMYTQFYRECRIWGTVDFIFGDAAAVFQDCYLYVRQPPAGKPGIITAHGGEYHDRTSGFIFQNCTVDISHLPGENLTSVLTYLGRPWRSHARVVFMLSSITSRIHADGWIPWNETHQTGGKAPAPDHVNHTYFASYQNRDLDNNKPVIWHNFTEITSEEAKKFTPQRFLHAKKWLRATGVPCYLGLGPVPVPVPLPLPRSQLEY